MERMTVGEYKVLVKATGKKKTVRIRSVGGTRADIGFFVRSKWEANYVRILRYSKTEFQYEKHEFEFPFRRGTRFYLPDFWLPSTDQFVELKGHMDQKSRTQLSRFLQFYPDKAKRMRIVLRKIFMARGGFTPEAAALHKIGYPMAQIIEYDAWIRNFSGVVPNWEN